MRIRSAVAVAKRAGTLLRHREKTMPDEHVALAHMFAAFERLRDFGFREIMYCPKDGTIFDAVEAGSTGIHRCHYDGDWPKGTWWIHDAGDLWPARPILYRLIEPKHDEGVAKQEDRTP
jgi:hypothetical protein